MTAPRSARVYAENALLPDGWAERVAIAIDERGIVTAVEPGAVADGCEVVSGPLVPAVANVHSHAFQRAMAGLAETRAEDGRDNFWSWREQMYRLVGLLGPEDVEAVSAKLFVELLKGGFGSVAEFHYLHHAVGGGRFDDPAELSRRVLAAAARSGIGLTLLPVFYAHSDFGGVAPNPGQARFIHDTDAYLDLLAQLKSDLPGTNASLGVAIHSLRAATPEEIREILAATPGTGPIHIHVAEQPREVEACLAWSNRRPMQFLLDEFPVDARWCLIHATHIDGAELAGLAQSGAVAGLCPQTEGNLGDGIFPATGYRAAGGRLGIGTDSQVATGVAEELRQLEYSQRLRDLRRNLLADGPNRSVGRSLFDAVASGGAQALGRGGAGIAVGLPADMTVLDGSDPFIATARGDQILDRWIFALGNRAVRDVMVRGQWRIRDRSHPLDEEIDHAFRGVLARLAAI